MLANSNPKWELRVSLQELQSTNKIVGLASSHVIRTLDRFMNNDDLEDKVREIKQEISYLQKEKSNKENKDLLRTKKHELFKLLYLPHLTSIHIDKYKHYDKLNEGFSITVYDDVSGEVISNTHYKRFLSTSASIKKSEVFYIDEDWKEAMIENLNCSRDMSKKFVAAKLSAYMALAMSSSNPVTNTYNVVVVNDVEHDIKTSVLELDDSQQEEPIIKQIDDYTMNLNCSDGFGFIDPDFAEIWASDLHLDYVPGGFITRQAFCKGVLARFPFKEFAHEYGHDTITDIWGKVWNIDDVDIILTESMLKLANSYSSWDDYYNKTQEHGYTFSITKYTPKTLDMERTTNYQFIQALDLSDEDIYNFLKPTIDEIKDIKGSDWRKSLVYLRGMSLNEDSDVIRNDYTTAMMIEPRIIKDSYVRASINNMIEKRINDAKKGTIKVRGNYQTLIIDPILLAQNMFGMELNGLLKAGEFHSGFWNNLGVDKVVCMRAPQVSYNNIVRANLIQNNDTKRWYRYINDLFILNGYDETCARASGADCDGDTFFSTDNEYIIKGAKREAPAVICLQKSASKIECDEKSFIDADKILLKGDVENVGVVTNRATAIESFKANFEVGSKEWLELDYRVKACIALSQNSIDCAKGIKIEYGFPKSWIQQKPNQILDNDSEDEITKKQFYQKLACDKKPYFFIYVYEDLYKEYTKFKRDENKRCMWTYGKTLDELMINAETEEEKLAVHYYNRKKIVDESPSLMNKVAWIIEKEFKNFKMDKITSEEYVDLLKSDVTYKEEDYVKVRALYDDYLKYIVKMRTTFDKCKFDAGEKEFAQNEALSTLIQKLNDVCSNQKELCNMVIDVCYKDIKKSKHFSWLICGDQIIQNLLDKNDRKLQYPIMVEDEEYDFMYKGYKFKLHSKGVDSDELHH